MNVFYGFCVQADGLASNSLWAAVDLWQDPQMNATSTLRQHNLSASCRRVCQLGEMLPLLTVVHVYVVHLPANPQPAYHPPTSASGVVASLCACLFTLLRCAALNQQLLNMQQQWQRTHKRICWLPQGCRAYRKMIYEQLPLVVGSAATSCSLLGEPCESI